MSLITPKTIVITAYPGKHGSISMQSNQSEYSLLDSVDFDSDGGGGPRKRRRLTHLSPDEKMLRRKLKNRVAAQTARDRKKALMQELEEKVAQLEEENKLLRRQNVSLKETSSSLAKENASLKSRLTDPVPTSIKTESEPPRSAAPAVPLQKEQVQNLSRWLAQYCAFVMMLSLMISSGCYKSLQTSESASNRKRKQLRPSRRVSVEEELVVKQEVEVKEEPTEPPHVAWWGSHQQSWNPSMN
ncbi:X-box-binding protein 1 [Aplysia californica]|uniref:X-box-binding protein 1 n=1 Tax=Aplysia californica TaxID=6500 RepID=A0ABM0JVF9_APLCA|nr:X-box-binding protein 1 [Aplysia californica]